VADGLTFIATCDLVGLTRGRSVRSAELAARRRIGVGWVPADLALTTFGDIADPNPFGSLGDLRLIPDGAPATLPAIAGRPATDVVLASIILPDGRPWPSDPRTALVDAVEELKAAGIRLEVAFEQEFTLLTAGGPPGSPGDGIPAPPPFSLRAHRLAEPFGSALVQALTDADMAPETWLPEYGTGQFEITIRPADPVTAGDRAILVREIVRDLATAHGMNATFAPVPRPDAVGNGVHVHLSLWDASDHPVTLDVEGGLTAIAGGFAAGILVHAEALVGWTAPSAVSSLRLAPHRWSSAAAFVGRQNREAMLRICPIVTIGGDGLEGANIEYRAADATANPWLVLAALIRAGLDGLTRGLPQPTVLDGELEALDPRARAEMGIRPLPADLESALQAIEADDAARTWFSPDLVATHLAIRRTELAILADATPEERCARYADVV
jgi:glutamine synthetase